jgi:hypothetical protein
MDLHSEVYVEPDVAVFRPPRSRLFSLKPIGVGTADCEGLVSYLVRLAREHSVDTRVLFRQEIFRQCGYLGGLRYANFFSDYARTLHGTGTYAESFADATATLTMRDDIKLLTMLPWRGVVPSIGNGLLGRHPKWCKACLGEFRGNRQGAYFPLGWYLELGTACRKHGIRLSDCCPWCQRRQPFLPFAPYIERCAYCNGWLGTKSRMEQLLPAEEWEFWLAGAIGDMIGHNPNAGECVSGEAFRRILLGLVEEHAGGEKGVFSRAMEMTKTTMSCWLTKGRKPLLPQFLKLCHRVGMLPSELFGMSKSAAKPALDTVCMPSRLHRIGTKFGLRETSNQAIAQALEQIVEDVSDCRSMAEVAQALGTTRGYLNYWHRASCRAISVRHKKHTLSLAREMRAIHQSEVRIATFRIYCSGIYPSRRKVYQAIKPLKLSLQRPELRAAHKKALKDLQG